MEPVRGGSGNGLTDGAEAGAETVMEGPAVSLKLD